MAKTHVIGRGRCPAEGCGFIHYFNPIQKRNNFSKWECCVCHEVCDSAQEATDHAIADHKKRLIGKVVVDIPGAVVV